MEFFKNLLYVILGIIALYVLVIVANYCKIRFIEHVNPIKPIKRSKYKKKSILKRIFVEAPKRIASDIANKNPNEFTLRGLHCFCGEQGSGKTIAMVEMIKRTQERFPLCKCETNFFYNNQDKEIESWRDIVFESNDIYGQIVALDEVQNWFSCNESKDFPPEMLQEISQQRKQHKVIFTTAQRYEQMAKQFRTQINYLYKPFTIFGCITFVRVLKPKVDDDGKLDKGTRTVKMYFFVHTDEIRNSYDTYLKIIRQANGGYNVQPPLQDTTISIFNDVKSKGKRR